MEQKWLIYSTEHGGMWWMPGSHGYTADRARAGHYSFEEALEIVTGANRYLMGDEPHETMCPVWED